MAWAARPKFLFKASKRPKPCDGGNGPKMELWWGENPATNQGFSGIFHMLDYRKVPRCEGKQQFFSWLQKDKAHRCMAIRRHGRSPFYQEILVSEESGTRCFSWVLLSCHSKNKKHQGLLSAWIPSPRIMVTLQPGLLKIRGLQFPVNELLTPRKMSIGIGQMQTKSGRLMMIATTNVLDLQASKFKESWSLSLSLSSYIYISLSLSPLYLSISLSLNLSISISIYLSICLCLSLSLP